MLLYVNREDINGATHGSKSCPIARMLNRKFPPASPDARWSVSLQQAVLLLRTPIRPDSKIYNVKKVVVLKLGKAARNFVNYFDTPGSTPQPQHIRLYPV